MAGYNIGRKRKRFRARAGVTEASANTTDEAIFIVRGDSQEQLRSAPMYSREPVSTGASVSPVRTSDVLCTVGTTTDDDAVYLSLCNAIRTVE